MHLFNLLCYIHSAVRVATVRSFRRRRNLPDDYDKYGYLRSWYFKSNWYEAYDFFEFIINLRTRPIQLQNISDQLNFILEREFSAYRFLDNQFVPITNENEINTINESNEVTKNFTALNVCNTPLAQVSDLCFYITKPCFTLP
jgi:hypothetical protein